MPIFIFSIVDTLNVQWNGDDINEEKTDNWTIEFNEDFRRDLKQFDCQANEYDDSSVNNLFKSDILSFWPFEDAEKSFSG